ncbi:hypothetical protein ACH5RR_015412 [Cinchona calisaya]|uniref:Uncharacterized protein n=1 Tax=Cinchona calisaya TaxID=153742 RepID=A0ABD2ZUB3_9GENT
MIAVLGLRKLVLEVTQAPTIAISGLRNLVLKVTQAPMIAVSSLRKLIWIGELPIIVGIYEEVIPCNAKLMGTDDKKSRLVFKAASLMASRHRTFLAMLVLLSIYCGHNRMAEAPLPGQSHASFLMHYVYAWSVYYFSTHYKVPNTLPVPMMTNYSREGGAWYFDKVILTILSIRATSLGSIKIFKWSLGAFSLNTNQCKGAFPILPLDANKYASSSFETWWSMGMRPLHLIRKYINAAFSSIVVKAKEPNATGFQEQKRDNSHVDEDEHSNNSDQHWKHKKKEVIIYALDESDLGRIKFFKEIPDISIPDVSLPRIV